MWNDRYDFVSGISDITPSPFTTDAYIVVGVKNSDYPNISTPISNPVRAFVISPTRSDLNNTGAVARTGTGLARIVSSALTSYEILDGIDQRSGDIRLTSFDQANQVRWTKILGGSSKEAPYGIITTIDKGFLISGTTQSNDGDIQGNTPGNVSGWLVKLATGSPLVLGQPTYNCSTGAITINTSGGDGSPITYSTPGISRQSATSNTGFVEQGLRNDPKTITITATQSGQSTSYSFDLKAFCDGTTPTTPTPTPTPPTTGGTLTLTQPTYNCSTGAITFNTTGGNGSTITYSAPGIMRSSATSNTGTVEQGLRNDPKVITITAMQSGHTTSYSFDLKAFCNGTTPTTPTMHPDMQPLVDLYNATNGPSWKNKTNWLTGNSPCNWFGVSCNANGRVTEVNFGSNNLNGTLPSSLGNLSELQRLVIFIEPLLSGTLPASLGNLSKLQLLEIEYTQISGSIPESLGNLKQLEQLLLAKNELSGSIPESLGNLSSLKTLYLFVNQLTGNLPNSFASLPQIQSLHLYANRFSGCIPPGYTALCGKDVQLSSNVGLPGGGDFAAFCANPSQNCGPNKLLILTQPTYNCSTGAITFNFANGDGSAITYSAPGIMRSSVTSNSGIVEQGLRNDPKTITITATQSGYSTSYSFDLKAFCNGTTPTPSSTLKLLAPVVDCSTRQVTLVTSGGDGSAITFNTPTITRSSATSPTGTVDRCVGVQPPVLQATQSGYTTTYDGFDFVKLCPAYLGVKPLVATQIPDVNLPLGQYTRITLGDYFKTETNPVNRYAPTFSFQLIGAPNGSSIDDQTSTVRSLQPYAFLQLNTFMTGVYTITVTGKNECDPAATSTFRLIVNPASGSSPFTLVAPTYNCSTGAFTFNYTGGNGSPVEFQAAGITGWTTNPNQFVDRDSRTANDVKPFTLMARQNGQVVTYTWDLKAACGRSARVAAAEAGQGLQLTVKGNPVGNTAIVDISGVEGQAVVLDLLNASGHVLEQRHIEQAGVVEEQRFELQRQPTGVLFLRAQSGQQHQTVKLIKQ
ncbi:leucine-rich repeat domain-containing protein [Spirosoma rhododendri]|uniref:Disease resistance R13L4/SHOC-2-like LRR domain-containing protein n=1 Tax=Spirosoma rhododendri TaxID=2728024 RepID=A0A7L5DLK1_9BACT|nr:hypothetical protein [Spirosoma rhododendri]QJD77318.1 hypothetical protein HH216_01950 [Spirosoma rhododendri]